MTLITEDAAYIFDEKYDHLQNKYERLIESHKKLLKVNQNLEDKLLKIVDRYETEKYSLIKEISSLNHQLQEAQKINQRLAVDNERYKSDISVAIQLLRCKPSNFSSCKLDVLPDDLQSRIKNHLQQDIPKNRSEKKAKVIRVPISAFPSTTVIYSVPPSGDDSDDATDEVVSASIVAKILEERQKEVDERLEKLDKPVCSTHLSQSRSMPFLDGLKFVDHGTQTYPAFIGEMEKTRNTCIYCQGTTGQHQTEDHSPTTKPKIFLYTENELAATKNLSTKHSRPHRRKQQYAHLNRSQIAMNNSVETDI